MIIHYYDMYEQLVSKQHPEHEHAAQHHHVRMYVQQHSSNAGLT